MFKKIISIVLSFIFIFSLASCTVTDQGTNPPASDNGITDTYMQIIASLQSKIDTLERESSKSSLEAKNEIDALKKELEELKKTTTPPDTPTPASIFSYKLTDGKAYITGFTGDDESIVIPSEIDGFEVVGIAERAFEGYKMKSVIISNGVQKIDWFAFYGCSNLVSITIPSSVSSIGYSAFDGTSRAFTVYCHSNSFAHSFAQSYGITFAII